MKDNFTFFVFKITIVTLFCAMNTMAQPEDKSYLKKSDPSASKQNNYIPISKHGPVVTALNLAEALKNPELYKSARFNNSGLTEFPEQLFLFPNIVELDLSRNMLKVLPSRLNEFKNLKELHVNGNQLTAFGLEITSCGKLEIIQIQNNPLVSISESIGEMASLKEITIGEIARTCNVPKELWTLTNLTKVKITNAYLTEIPAAIGSLQQLNELCLEGNLISDVPEELYTVKNLTYLNLGHNKVKSLSPSIKKLEKLDYIGVYYNPIKAFPEEIDALKELSFLSCWKTALPQSEILKARAKLPKTEVHDTETGIH